MELADGLVLKFKSAISGKYVRPIGEVQPVNAFLSAEEPDPLNPIVQFGLEASSTDEMWHIKCLSTGKYLQVKLVGNIYWITADAVEKTPDTFFSIEQLTPGTTTIRLRLCSLNRFVFVYNASDTYPNCLCALYDLPDEFSNDVFVFYLELECK
ncbi:hypothetical protein LOK49_LG12G00709 [Camellia lanceoleosa]|uniref:Uncharacterized protein n=1 Tax=Camellia lanceoleosa TaxID=1840588 RepID=A0ACC0FN97_9ERIC|nr:hypothetical protein LOK49_LG12G00709 [Camellia lanceoleosa]